MAQHDYVIANGTGAAVRSDLNNALAAIVSQNSGATAPSTTYAYQWWADTTTGLLKLRNAANNGWITLFQLDGEWSTIAFENGSASAPSIYFKDSGTDTGIYSPGTDQVAISTAGTGRLFVNASGNVGLGTSSPSQLFHLAANNCNLYLQPVSNAEARIQAEGGTAGTGTAITFHNYNGVSNGERVRIDGSGRVGIGSNAPSYTLDVNATGSTISSAFRTDQSENWVALKDSGTTIGHVRLGSASGAMLFYAGNSERGRFDSSGRFLVGTSSGTSVFDGITPQFQIEGTGYNSSSASLFANSNDANGAYLTFGKSRGTSIGSSTIVSSGDLIGGMYWVGADGTDRNTPAASIYAYVDGTPGANDMPGRLVFSTTADGASSPTERMRISNTGEINTYSTGTGVVFSTGASAGTSVTIINGQFGASNTQTGSLSFRVWSNGNVVNTNNSYGAISDAKLKENIVDAGSQWNDLKSLQVRKYNFKEGQTHTQIGLIAQEAELVSPGLVYESPDRDAEGNDLGTVTKSVNYSVLYMKAVKALQEAMERIEVLEQRLTDAGIA